MKIMIGMFGFGRTGSVVAKEIIKDEICELSWVLRKSTAMEGKYASRLLGFDHNEGMIYSIEDIDPEEEHFRDKRDVSGTALRIAEDLGLDKRQHVNSIRVGGIVGKHEVIFGLPNQTIRIVHESLNRAAFGQGAIYAAKWLMGKDKGIYTMEEAVALNFVNNTNVFEVDE